MNQEEGRWRRVRRDQHRRIASHTNRADAIDTEGDRFQRGKRGEYRGCDSVGAGRAYLTRRMHRLAGHPLASALGAAALRRHGLRELRPTGEISTQEQESREHRRDRVAGSIGQRSHRTTPKAIGLPKRHCKKKQHVSGLFAKLLGEFAHDLGSVAPCLSSFISPKYSGELSLAAATYRL